MQTGLKTASILFTVLAIMAAASCGNGGNGKKNSAAGTGTSIHDSTKTVLPDSTISRKIVPEYAEGFSVREISSQLRLVEIRDPQSSLSGSYRYALAGKGADLSQIDPSYTVIHVPVRKVICMTSLQLSNFIKLDATELVSGITSSRHLFNEKIQERVSQGLTARIGIEGNFDNETIMAADPDLILISPFKRGGYNALMDVGIPLIPHLGYKEMTPLGQAEWIKFIGMLTGLESEAITAFDGIEKRYNHLRDLADKATPRPVVFSGEMRGGNWYAVGGKSFLAKLFSDAGADYFLKDDNRSGGINLNYETVYSRAAKADYWRIVNSYNGTFTYDALKDSDIRYADFDAYRNRKVIYCNMREKPFYESMPVEPEVVLADLIAIFHPELLPEHEARYYELLK